MLQLMGATEANRCYSCLHGILGIYLGVTLCGFRKRWLRWPFRLLHRHCVLLLLRGRQSRGNGKYGSYIRWTIP